jgi:hypothetical protein
LGDCLQLSAASWKLQIMPKMLVYSFPQLKSIHFDKQNGLGYILGVFIIKRIWSPRRQSRYQSFFRGV